MNSQILKDTQMRGNVGISQTLKNMQQGDTVEFPIEKMTTVRYTIHRLQKEKKLSFSTFTDEDFIHVTRNEK